MLEVDPGLIRQDPRTVSVAREFGYDVEAFDGRAIRRRYLGAAGAGLDRIGRFE